jgi:hypothetical protein
MEIVGRDVERLWIGVYYGCLEKLRTGRLELFSCLALLFIGLAETCGG